MLPIRSTYAEGKFFVIEGVVSINLDMIVQVRWADFYYYVELSNGSTVKLNEYSGWQLEKAMERYASD